MSISFGYLIFQNAKPTTNCAHSKYTKYKKLIGTWKLKLCCTQYALFAMIHTIDKKKFSSRWCRIYTITQNPTFNTMPKVCFLKERTWKINSAQDLQKPARLFASVRKVCLYKFWDELILLGTLLNTDFNSWIFVPSQCVTFSSWLH